METSINILIVSEWEQNTAQLKTIAESFSSHVTTVNYSDAIREMNRETRDIVIVSQFETDASVEVVQSIRLVNPACLLLFVANASDFTLLRSIIRSGADEFFVFPDEASLFASRFPTIVKNYENKKNSMEEAAVTYGRNRGKIFSFYSGKGGSGRTLIASSVAQTLKLESTAEVILIDLNTQYGGIESVFSIESNRSMADLMPVVEELNESHIRNVSETQVDSKLEILISPCDAEIAESIDEIFIAKLVRTCRRSFDYVLIDLPSHINAQVVAALEESDKIYYILAPETPALKTLKQFESLSARLGIHLANRMEIVMNELAKENEVQQNDLKNVLRFPIAASIRRDIKGLQPFINKGMPIRKIQKERKLIPFAKDIRKFARDVLKQ
ncbi:AAA family ATPase [Paenisporosarcina indica]|uniref:AAA family ATPase n=1 Tax=Paenisporosarcina indica TaxID=650093 RepID=UPI00094F4ADC|nr:AAA family ATPase [Paenisporosarcina indica]